MREDTRRSYSDGVLQLELEDIERILPQRSPMLLLDRVRALVPGAHAVGVKAVTGNEAGLSTRRAGFVYPSTFILESLVQLASVTLLYDPELLGTPDPVDARPGRGHELELGSDAAEVVRLVEVADMRVDQEMTSGGRVFLHVAILSRELKAPGTEICRVRGSAELSGKKFVDASFTLERKV